MKAEQYVEHPALSQTNVTFTQYFWLSLAQIARNFHFIFGWRKRKINEPIVTVQIQAYNLLNSTLI